jgi:hypothetical protein
VTGIPSGGDGIEELLDLVTSDGKTEVAELIDKNCGVGIRVDSTQLDDTFLPREQG